MLYLIFNSINNIYYYKLIPYIHYQPLVVNQLINQPINKSRKERNNRISSQYWCLYKSPCSTILSDKLLNIILRLLLLLYDGICLYLQIPVIKHVILQIVDHLPEALMCGKYLWQIEDYICKIRSILREVIIDLAISKKPECFLLEIVTSVCARFKRSCIIYPEFLYYI